MRFQVGWLWRAAVQHKHCAGHSQGFLLKAVSSNKPPESNYERETIAITDCAGTLFSVGIRLFLAFSITVRCTATGLAAALMPQSTYLPPTPPLFASCAGHLDPGTGGAAGFHVGVHMRPILCRLPAAVMLLFCAHICDTQASHVCHPPVRQQCCCSA